MKRFLLCLFLFGFVAAYAGNFTPGNIVVLRIGTGSTLLTNAAQPVFLDEYTRAGVLVQSIPLPTSASGSNHPLALSGTATSEGTLTLSANGQYLVLAGYDAVPGTVAVVGDSMLNRVIARVGTNGVPNTSTGILAGAAYTQDNIRAAVSSDGSKFWTAGNGTNDRGGTYYLPYGSFTGSPVKVSSPPNNTRTVSIFNNQLYISSQTNTYNGVSIVGSGLPTTAGHTSTLFPGFTVPSTFSIFSFWLFDMNPNVPGMDVLYFCDDRDVAPNGGLYKYSLVNGNWVSNGNITVPNNIKGITAERTCFTQIFCSSGTRIFSLRDDNGYNQPMSGTMTQIAMAASNTKFRGIAFAPGTSPLTQLQASAVSTNVSCFNAGSGSINLTVNGGVSPYEYDWNDGNHSKNRSNLSPGTYQVTVTDANECSAAASATITQPAQLGVNATKTDVSCNGGNNGSITLTVNGGTPNYTFNWSGGSTSQNRNNLSAGIYNVTITDSKGCIATASVTIAQPAALSASATKTNVSCNGGSNGSVTLSVSGGVAPYGYLWSNNATIQNLSGLTAGIYTVTVTDARSCTATSSATLTQPSAINLTSTVTNVNCNGGNNGSIVLAASGGVSPYNYNWSNGSGSQDISNLSAGTFHVTVQDNNGCSAAETNIVITQPAALSLTIAKTNVSCNGGGNGAVDLNVAGGTGPYSYTWSNNTTSQDISSLTAGIYNVTVSDANSCSSTTGTTITQPATLSISLTKTNVSCNGGINGSIDLSVSGGTAAYNYLWSNNTITQDLSGVSAAIYSVTVTDANSCSVSGGAAITEPAMLATTTSKIEVSCNGGNNGSIDLTVSGGVSPYSYVWSNSASTQDINSLQAGTYNVTITDANSCIVATGAVISEPALLTASLTKTDVLCNGDNTGSVELTVNGGTLSYSYLWSNNVVTQNIANLAAAFYSVTITDGNNCTATGATTVTQPSAISIDQIVTDASCNGGADGAIDISVNGGVAAYAFSWSTGSNSEDITGVSAGLYHITVTDDHGCSKSKAISIGESSALAIALITKSDLTCNGGNNGTIDILVSGGMLPYAFVWSNGSSTEDLGSLAAGDYTVTVSDANNCSKVENYVINTAPVLSPVIVRKNTSCFGGNDGEADLSVSGGRLPYSYIWSSGQQTEDIGNLVADVYLVTVTDINGCNAAAGTLISEPAAIETSFTKMDVNCYGGNDGSIDLSVTGGTSPYGYNWSNGTSLQDAGSLTEGSYDVTVTDGKGCTATVNVSIAGPAQLSIVLTKSDVRCNGGSDGAIHLDVSGGVASYSFDWSNGVSTADNTGLSADSYAVTVQDAHGCLATATTAITEPGELIVNAHPADVSCYAGNDGAVTLEVSGGVSGYIFHWSNGDSLPDITGLIAGNYSVTVTDDNGCTALDGVTLAQPAEMLISAAVANPVCAGGSEGAIDLTVSGGTAGYAFAWSNSAVDEDVAGLPAGEYNVTVTDGNSCVKTFSANVTHPSALEVTRSVTDVTCSGLGNGAISLAVSGGTPGYVFAWSNEETTQGISNLAAGIYSVIVNDGNGCSLTTSDTITEPAAIVVLPSAMDITCFGAGNGIIDLSVSGGNPPYSFNWSNGAATEEIRGLVTGLYAVTVSDNNSCTAILSANVSEPDSISVTASVDHASLFGASDGSVTLSVEGGSGDFYYSWSSGESTASISNIIAGNYCVTISDENSCALTRCFTVNQPPSSVHDKDFVYLFKAYFISENLLVQAQMNEYCDARLQIFDITGKLLAAKDLKKINAINEEISFNAYAGSCYFVNVLTEKGSFSRKVIYLR